METSLKKKEKVPETKEVQKTKHNLLKVRNRLKTQPQQISQNVNLISNAAESIINTPADCEPVWKEIFILVNTFYCRYVTKIVEMSDASQQNNIIDSGARIFNFLLQEIYITKLSEKQQKSIRIWNDELQKIRNNLINGVNSTKAEEKSQEIPRRLQIVETVLARRTSRIALVLERCHKSLNHQAVLRTAECLGIQYVYVILPKDKTKTSISKKVTKGTESYLSIKKFTSTTDCINQLRSDNREIWATDLSISATDLTTLSNSDFPERLALVIGNEVNGVSDEMLEAADKRVYLPLYGFADSLNLSVASALIIQHLFFMCPEARGTLGDQEKEIIRSLWYEKLSGSKPKKREIYSHFLKNPPPPLEDLRKPDDLRQSYLPKKLLKRITDSEEMLEGEIEERKSLDSL